MEIIKIDKGKLIPTPKRTYPWKDMKVGDSFWIELKEGQQANSLQGSTKSAATQFCYKFKKDWQFTTRREGNGVRIWRIK